MLKGSSSIRVIVLAVLVLAVAFSSTIGSRLSLGRVSAASNPATSTSATVQSQGRAVEKQKLNSAWQAQLSTEQSMLHQAQQQQQASQQQAGNAKATITPPTPTPTPTPSPTPTPAPASNAAPASTPASSGGSIQSIIEAAFASLGSGAVQWGLCVAEHESGDNPNAVNPSGASGLFQFMPSTFANTPPGQAGGSIWDPTANSQAAAWMYSQGRQAEWSTNSMC